MCGRFTLVPGGAEQVPEHFDVHASAPPARWNLAPSQEAPVVRIAPGAEVEGGIAGTRELVYLAWGLLPAWVRDPRGARAPINARAETVAEKPSFRAAYARRRCLVPASGWYEWEKPPADSARPRGVRAPAKQPWLLWPEFAGSPDDRGLFAMAGIWERWEPRGEVGEVGDAASPRESFAILTTEAHASIAGIHPRMPVVLRPEEYRAWLEPGADREHLQALLRPSGRPGITARPVSPLVNHARSESPQCIQAAAGLY